MFKLSHLVKSVVKFDIKCVFTHQGSLVYSANSVTRVFDGVFCKIQNLPCCTHKGKSKCQFPTLISLINMEVGINVECWIFFGKNKYVHKGNKRGVVIAGLKKSKKSGNVLEVHSGYL